MYTASAEALVRLYFGERFKYHLGDSQKLVPAFARNNSKLCDVLLVDGAHSYAGALHDIRNMHALAKPGAVLLVDDLDEGPGPALEAARASGLIEVTERFMFNESAVGDPVNPCIPVSGCPIGIASAAGAGPRRAIYSEVTWGNQKALS